MWEVLRGRGGPRRALRVLELPEVPGVPVTPRGPGVPSGVPSRVGPQVRSRRSLSEQSCPTPSSLSPAANGKAAGGQAPPRSFKAAPRARRRQRGERPPGRRLPPWSDRPACHGESRGLGTSCPGPLLAVGAEARGSGAPRAGGGSAGLRGAVGLRGPGRPQLGHGTPRAGCHPRVEG